MLISCIQTLSSCRAAAVRGWALWMCSAALALLAWPGGAPAGVGDLRLAEVSPHTDQVEVVNTSGTLTLTSALPFSHAGNTASEIPNGTSFTAGERKVFTVTGLSDTLSDVCLYRDTDFTNPAKIIHFTKYGGATIVGRESEAFTAGLWPSAAAFAPAPASGSSLTWDEAGFETGDWFLNEAPALGSPFSPPTGVVASNIAWPSGTDDFEHASLLLGYYVTAVSTWPVVNDATASVYSVRIVNDAAGVIAPRPSSSSTQWLRVKDDHTPNQNRFYSPFVTAPSGLAGYTWSQFVYLEKTPPGGSDIKPRITTQHTFSGTPQNVWGVEFADVNTSLFVTSFGGAVASTPIDATIVGNWFQIDMTVNLIAGTVTGAINGGTPVSLPIAPAINFTETNFRWCFRGEGAGNVSQLLIDDISFQGYGVPPSGVEMWQKL